ncbi:MAG: hypothetical protein GKR91_06330 [Pseudomonadales bacterium]|nr:hypothetical protein [Pseudomonadales bacterium]
MFTRPYTKVVRSKQWLAGFLFLVFFISFGTSSQPGVQESTSDTISDENLHGLMVERLNELQQSIEQLVYQQNRTQSQIDQTRRTSAAEIATTALELRDSVQELEMIEPSLSLSPSNRTVFLALIQRLRDDSQSLADLAMGTQIGNLDEAVLRLQENCETCHALYRD